MKEPGYPALLELSVALLVFMLASTTLLSLFTDAYARGADARARTRALIYAQDCAQRLSAQGDTHSALLEQGYEQDQDGAYVRHTQEALSIRVHTQETQTAAGTLMQAQITVQKDGEVLAQLPAARYEERTLIIRK